MPALDRYGRKWHPYMGVMLSGEPEILFGPQGADTDMGDLSRRELEEMLGPITFEP